MREFGAAPTEGSRPLEALVGRHLPFGLRCTCSMHPDFRFRHLRQVVRNRIPRSLEVDVNVFVRSYYRIIIEQTRRYKP